MNTEEIKQLVLQGFDCSHVVAGSVAETLDMDEQFMNKVSSCCAGRILSGDTSGAITGALIVLGLQYGHTKAGDTEQKVKMQEKVVEFKTKFLEQYPSCICKDLLGHDISKTGEMEKVLEKGLLFDLCPRIVKDVIDILKSEIEDSTKKIESR